MNNNTGATKISSDLEKHELVVERTFNAPRELVWQAWTDADRLAQWWGPTGWQTTSYKLEVKPGGVWHYCMRGPDGMESWGKGIYSEVSAPERLVYLDVFSDAEGNQAENMPVMQIEIDFIEENGRTRVVNCSRFATKEELEKVLEMGVVQGVTETWDRLEEYLAAA